MNDNQQLLLIDTPPHSPLRSRQQTQQENLLLGINEPEISTMDNTYCVAPKPPQLHLQTWSYNQRWKQQTNFFWEVQSSEEEDVKDDTGNSFNQEYYKNQEKYSNFPYAKLMMKLQKALELIQEKQKKKEFALYSSTKHVKSLSSYQKSTHRQIKTQRNHKDENQEQEKRKQVWKKKINFRKSITQPDEDRNFQKKIKARGHLKQSFILPKVINEVEETPKNKKGEKLRTKEEFLASITNWQQKKKIKQQERIQKQQAQSMNGVTFAPQINAKSKQLMKKKGNLLPIYQRDMRSKKTDKAQNQIPKHVIKSKK